MDLDIQLATSADTIPTYKQLELWTTKALAVLGQSTETELTIRFVDNDEIQQLNYDYRNKNKPTNVLSFPFEPYEILGAYAGDAFEINLLGDIVIAPAVIEAEACQQHKTLLHHYAHMTIHGILHLLGYDHENDEEAEEMESLEIKILAELDIDNPYAVS